MFAIVLRDSTKKIDNMKIGVIGAGWWGKNIINTLEYIDLVHKIYYSDQDPNVQEKFSANKKAIFIRDADELISSIDITSICIATPPATHYELTKQALLAGKHVFVEKPPALSSGQIVELGEIAQASGLTYMLDALFLFLEPIQKIKEILCSGILKEIHHVEMYRIGDELRREGAGIQRIQKTMFDNQTDVVEDLFFHDAGILLNLFQNLELKSINKSYFYSKTFCDTAKIEFDTGNFPVSLTLSWALTGRRRGISVYDRDYILEYDAFRQENQVTLYNLSENQWENFSSPNIPPLQSMLEFFIQTVITKSENPLDHNFMFSLINLWENIQHAK